MKLCKKCKQEKLLTEFCKQSYTIDNLSRNCKQYKKQYNHTKPPTELQSAQANYKAPRAKRFFKQMRTV